MAPLVGDMKAKDRPISEVYRLASLRYLDKRKAFRLLDETKTSHLELLKSKHILSDPKMSETKAERLVKSSPEWREYLVALVAAEHDFERARQGLIVVKMRFDEWVQSSAHARQEYRMGSGHGQ